ncbi:beta-ketoacyl synthase N-terminal-like domain-containing protein [Nanchangia anserum]|uniref:beta-ketoacyl synthase N-terminal-like domain-containing protein n=1 Tax=Nanchangia anserum TaxID=2692125 RepID=UPI001D12D3D1|nr:beta-ketoacyl synthase N-terminal-like domain-containing protein [Nanchangia anserum]
MTPCARSGTHEAGWPQFITLAHPQIGWVSGTSLMGANDALIPAAKAAGIDVMAPEDLSRRLLDLADDEARERAASAPLQADFTGGLAEAGIDLAAMAREVRAQAQSTPTETEAEKVATVPALPTLCAPTLATRLEWSEVSTPLAEQVVIVGLGEVSAWGTGRTRHSAEFGAEVELTAAGIMELAWGMGLITWQDSQPAGWVDAEGTPVPETEIADRFRDEVIARCGIRPLADDEHLRDAASIDVATVYLPSEQTFAVADEAEARDYLAADGTHTEIWCDEGTWYVRKAAGAKVRVPKRATLTRTVGGQIPTDFDPTRWGITPAMASGLDRIAQWNLVTAVEAFISSGFSPTELLQACHPADVSTTQGTGIGGMMSLRKVFLDRFLGEDRPADILQEALPNVVAAHTMQAYIGGYGQMIHPVGACATAAVSIEEGVDKIRLGKSSFVVAGGIDDISVESLTGFGDMNATARSSELAERGIESRYFSRAGDRRRGGFLEAAGGGTVLLTRGDIAADLGLPVYGVVAYARSFGDGAHQSIPAPGLGVVAAGRGGTNSQLARDLAGLGLTASDIAVVSKHDTSTRANDPNEANAHARLARALEREVGNPLYVVSQKTVTGHAKGGAALFQVAGLTEMFTHQVIPGNRALDCLDPQMREYMPLLWLRAPLRPAQPIRAGVLTSLGFGHVGALVVLAHPSAFEQALADSRGEKVAKAWRERALSRLRAGHTRRLDAMCGGEALFSPVTDRRFGDLSGDALTEAEAAVLLSPDARLDATGRLVARVDA